VTGHIATDIIITISRWARPVVCAAGRGLPRVTGRGRRWRPLVKSRALPLSLAGHLVLQRKRADCGIASSVIAALCHLGGENANRQSEHERGGDSDYALGHHGSPLGFEVTLHA